MTIFKNLGSEEKMFAIVLLLIAIPTELKSLLVFYNEYMSYLSYLFV